MVNFIKGATLFKISELLLDGQMGEKKYRQKHKKNISLGKAKKLFRRRMET